MGLRGPLRGSELASPPSRPGWVLRSKAPGASGRHHRGEGNLLRIGAGHAAEDLRQGGRPPPEVGNPRQIPPAAPPRSSAAGSTRSSTEPPRLVRGSGGAANDPGAWPQRGPAEDDDAQAAPGRDGDSRRHLQRVPGGAPGRRPAAGRRGPVRGFIPSGGCGRGIPSEGSSPSRSSPPPFRPVECSPGCEGRTSPSGGAPWRRAPAAGLRKRRT